MRLLEQVLGLLGVGDADSTSSGTEGLLYFCCMYVFVAMIPPLHLKIEKKRRRDMVHIFKTVCFKHFSSPCGEHANVGTWRDRQGFLSFDM